MLIAVTGVIVAVKLRRERRRNAFRREVLLDSVRKQAEPESSWVIPA